MNLKHLSDDALLENTKNLVQRERELLTTLLYHLKEIDRRRLFSALKYKSLHHYAEKELGYPGDQAYRRIAAMRVLKELPEIAERITSGALSLTNLGMARSLFNKENYSREEKLNFLESIENTSTREAAKVIATVSPEVLSIDRVRPVSEDKVEFKFVAPQSLQEKLERLKGKLAHSHPNISQAELIDWLADLGLAKFAAPQKSSRQQSHSKAEIMRQVAMRDHGACINCQSNVAVEIDHIVPKAAGGAFTLSNLRLLCRKCNQRAAIDYFGVDKMARFLRSPVIEYTG